MAGKEYALAQLNLAKFKYPRESAEMSDFVDNLDRINALAESSEGFIWRLQDEAGDATALRPFGEELLVNLSLWRDVDALHHFVFATQHKDFLRRRPQWFHKMDTPYVVLWWLPAGTLPDLGDAGERIELLRREGPSPRAFSFRQRFDPPLTDG